MQRQSRNTKTIHKNTLIKLSNHLWVPTISWGKKSKWIWTKSVICRTISSPIMWSFDTFLTLWISWINWQCSHCTSAPGHSSCHGRSTRSRYNYQNSACFSVCPPAKLLCALRLQFVLLGNPPVLTLCKRSVTWKKKSNQLEKVSECVRVCVGERKRERKGEKGWDLFKKILLHRVGLTLLVQNVTSHWYNES